ncbi:MAG: UDP-galactopyranose mutase [Planctomycetota bacterium]|nr:MAG: UDP-galactopyranose mutase [Planctomycetota bacterium]
MRRYDYLVVGCGMFGAVFARRAAEAGRRVRVIDKRPHIAGNCYSEQIAGVEVHRYGPHIFHTDNPRVWQFLNRFTEFNNYTHHGRVRHGNRVWSFPINLMTLAQLWGIRTPAEAERKLHEVRVPCEKPQNLQEWILSQVGEELYEIFVRGYTTKQWGRDPAELPPSIIRRIPIRQTYDDRYFADRFQGVPIGGYTHMFANMLDHDAIDVELGVDYFEHAGELEGDAERVVYTGKIDEYFGYRFGELEYRSLRFENEVLEGDFQGTAIVNYTEAAVPFTRITEHKHFEFQTSRQTVITREYPAACDRGQVPYYPIRDAANAALYERYRAEAGRSGLLLGGRLATYQYYDMHQVVAQALTLADKEFQREDLPVHPPRLAA